MKSLGRLQLLLSASAALAASPAQIACNLLQKGLGDSVFFPGSPNYDQDIAHSLLSSTENATCSVEPGSVGDIAKILKIIGDTRTPFGVKSGGHALELGFSSTTGVEIALSKFSAVEYDPESQTVSIQPGTTWDRVYTQIAQYNVTVAGGRIKGVGVGGLALGGGFSFVSNEYGLTVDNIISYDLVLPNGTFTTVTATSSPDLFFALKGGLNNFGIVTSFTLKAVPLGQIWGGSVLFPPEQNERVAAVIANYSLYNTDPKSSAISVYLNFNGKGQWASVLFYNAPVTEPPAVLQPFVDIPNVSSNISARSFIEFLDVAYEAVGPNLQPRGASHATPIIKYTLPVLDAVQESVNEIWAQAVKDNRSVSTVNLVVEPFLSAFDFEVPSAYPHHRSRPVNPTNPEVIYTDGKDAQYAHDAVLKLSKAVQEVAVREGQSRWDDICYLNYAVGGTPLELLYGENVPRLRAIKKAVDPKNVMGLAGGFKL